MLTSFILIALTFTISSPALGAGIGSISATQYSPDDGGSGSTGAFFLVIFVYAVFAWLGFSRRSPMKKYGETMQTLTYLFGAPLAVVLLVHALR